LFTDNFFNFYLLIQSFSFFYYIIVTSRVCGKAAQFNGSSKFLSFLCLRDCEVIIPQQRRRRNVAAVLWFNRSPNLL